MLNPFDVAHRIETTPPGICEMPSLPEPNAGRFGSTSQGDVLERRCTRTWRST